MPLNNNDPILGAVGVLQFDVVLRRLQDEYKVDALYEQINIQATRRVVCDDDKMLEELKRKCAQHLAMDGGGYLTYLAPTRVNLSLAEERWPDIRFRQTREH